MLPENDVPQPQGKASDGLIADFFYGYLLGEA